MTATILEIVEKTKTFPFSTALPENFVTRPAGTVDAQIILDKVPPCFTAKVRRRWRSNSGRW